MSDNAQLEKDADYLRANTAKPDGITVVDGAVTLSATAAHDLARTLDEAANPSPRWG